MKLPFFLVAVASLAIGATGKLDVPFFSQQKNGCGAASVAMVAHYWQRDAPPPERVYQQLYRAERGGIPLADMRRYVAELGLRAFTFRGEWDDLEENLAKRRPVIVALKKKRNSRLHFAVLLGAEGNHVWLNDPTRNKPRRFGKADFEKQWQAADRWLLLAAPAAN